MKNNATAIRIAILALSETEWGFSEKEREQRHRIIETLSTLREIKKSLEDPS